MNDAGAKETMRHKAFRYVKVELKNNGLTNRKYFGSGKVFFLLTRTYMNDPFFFPRMGFSVRDQIPPLRDAAHHSGRNDKRQPCPFRRKIDVFLGRRAATKQSMSLA
ncbi:MAG: hypothetical protein A2Z25_21755 [Planctomycetes bacterium RBG_16_55_9]|nr:MAG: hypothetical protein A2Z25_21755 [Planctomycetes bacterium RBG_16_55_9]